MMFSSIIGVTIPAVPHRLTLAATESACYLVFDDGEKSMVLSIWCWFFSAVPTAQALAGTESAALTT